MEQDETLLDSPNPEWTQSDNPAQSPQAAYDYLSSVAFPHGLYPDTAQVLDDVLDDVMQTVTQPLFAIARALDGADQTRMMPDGIFHFVSAVYEQEAQNGDDDAVLYLGRLYYYNHYGHQDHARAAALFEQAVEADVDEAFYLLGKCCLEGDGLPQDAARAFHIMTKQALVAQDCGCCMLLGDMYQQGLYVDCDPVTAEALYNRAWDICSNQKNSMLAADILLRMGRMQLAVPLEESGGGGAWRAAQFYFQQAELCCYDQRDLQIEDAEEKLQEARQGQADAREKIENLQAQQAEQVRSLS